MPTSLQKYKQTKPTNQTNKPNQQTKPRNQTKKPNQETKRINKIKLINIPNHLAKTNTTHN